MSREPSAAPAGENPAPAGAGSVDGGPGNGGPSNAGSGNGGSGNDGSGNDGSGAPLITTPALAAQRQTASAAAGTEAPAVPGDFSWSGYFQAIGLLIALLVALWLGLRFLRRLGHGSFVTALPRQALRLEAQLPLGRQKGIAVVRFLNKRLVLGVTDQCITLLTETEADETIPFHQALAEADSDAHGAPDAPDANAAGPGYPGAPGVDAGSGVRGAAAAAGPVAGR